jgi:hypothetical protein
MQSDWRRLPLDVEQLEQRACTGKVAGIDRQLRSDADGLVRAHWRRSRNLTSP